jgi:hypothetical protein
VTLTDDELDKIKSAAEQAGMATAAWLSQAGMDRAEMRDMPASEALRDALAALIRANALVRKIGTLLNQAVAALHATGTPGPALERAARAAERRMERLDDAVRALSDEL